MRWIICILILQGVSFAAQPTNVDALLQSLVDEKKVPAMVAAIVDGDQVIAVGAAGVRKLGSPEKVTSADEFHIGSCTKAMTATLCAMLVEEKRLRWDLTLAEVFPELRGKMDDNWRKVTLEHLLTHHSGLREDRTPYGVFGELRKFDKRPADGRQFLLENLIKSPLEHAPGEKFAYSNFGYTLAGHMAERVMGKPYEELMREKVFTPLGMNSAGFGPPGRKDQLIEPWGHTAAGKPAFGDNPLVIAPGGCVHLSIADWGKFVAIHSHGGRLISPESLEKLHHKTDDSGAAMGWFVTDRPWANGLTLTHNGTNTEWFAVVWVAPKRDFAVLAACNQGGDVADKACDMAASKLIQTYEELKKGGPGGK